MSSKYAPVPRNYFCKTCGKYNDHWIMDCELLTQYINTKNAYNKIWGNKETRQLNNKTCAATLNNNNVCQFTLILLLK